MKQKSKIAELARKYPTMNPRKATKQQKAAYNHKVKMLGKFGAASRVRVIDPATVDVSKYLEGK